MAYCFECGEQIAENDIFCPYCGISIKPIAMAGGEDDDAYGKTIDVSLPISVTAPSEAPPFAESVDESFEKESAASFSHDKTGDFSNEVTSGNVDVKAPLANSSGSFAENQLISNENQTAERTEFIDERKDFFNENPQNENLPIGGAAAENDSIARTPKISETSDPAAMPLAERFPTSFAGENAVESSANSGASAVKPADDLGVKFEFTLSKNADGENKPLQEVAENIAASDSQTESSLMSYEEADVKEIASAEEPEKSVDETAAEIEQSPVETPFAAPAVFDNIDAKAKPDSPLTDSAQNESHEKSDDAENLEAAAANENPIAVAAETPIAMPDIELPAIENCPPSRFDSVSIMEKKEETKEEPQKVLAASESPELAKIAEPSKGGGSFTSPIAANSDTGGKNKAKLKPLDEGTVLNGRYEVIRKIGGGGMGAVYLASDKNLGGVLRAVKEMVQSYIEDEQQEKAVNDFKRESLLLTSLDHQSIPTIYDYFFDETEARFYLVMKYISGGDLAGRLRSAPESRIDEREVTDWAIQIADVLDYLHNRQPPIVYRDLKPANIMIDGNSGKVMLIDFGIARWVNKEEKGVTAVGTMGYAPPELFSGNVEARSDIYSLGSTMFHLLTGADPQSNPLLIFDFQKHPRPRQINPQLSDQMERILMRAVEYNADKRFASAAELRRALEEHRESLKTGRASYGVKEAPLSVALSDQPVFCGFCGQKIVATDMFCAFCGSKQPLAQHGVHAHSEGYAPAPLTAQLLIIGTSDLEQPAFRLEKEDNLVGRRDPMSNIFPEVDLSKYDPQTKISRRHARIWRTGNEFMLEDLGSSNGTYILPIVNDTMRLQPRQPQPLTNGDKIRLGDTTLHFILG